MSDDDVSRDEMPEWVPPLRVLDPDGSLLDYFTNRAPRPDPGLPQFRGAWCEGCGLALQQTSGGDWIHLLTTGRLPSMQCDRGEVQAWQQIKAGRGL